MAETNSSKPEIKVFISHRESVCAACGEELGRSAWITLDPRGALCLGCGDLDHLVFLPTGDAALTRRAKKESSLSAVVLRFSTARGRYERQGLLVEADALDRAEAACLADAAVRERRRARDEERRTIVDEAYVQRFAEAVRAAFPGCPPEREITIAQHACEKHSGRVGRSEAARLALDPEAVKLAVVAHIRHTETPYDSLLMAGLGREEARARVRDAVASVLAMWQR